MGTLDEKKELLRKEISSLLDKISGNRLALLSEDAAGMEPLLREIELLQRKCASLQFLLTLPPETPPVSVTIEEPVRLEPVIPVVPEKKPETPRPVPQPEAKKEPAPQPETKKETVPQPEVKKETVPQPEVKMEPVPAPGAGKKLPDIHGFIGFNERLMFQRYLFRNDAAAYEEAIGQINRAASREEAHTLLRNLQAKYEWSSGSEPVQIFTDTVNRRFA